MTQEEKAKAYDEALDRAKKELQTCGSTDCDGARQIFRFFPQLRESEDERIRRTLVEYFGPKAQLDFVRGIPIQKIREWLEKQKDHFRDDTKKVEKQDYSSLNDLERAIHRGFLVAGVENVSVTIIKETAKECLEQMKPVKWSEEDEQYFLVCKNALSKYQRSDHWDANIISKWLETRLKSLRPVSKESLQPHEEIYQSAKRDLAIKFMNYLDENRPDGKMCLSNAESEDIDKAFKENDLAKIVRYYEKYRPHWKPSEEQMDALKDIAYGTYQNGDGPALRELYEQLKKLI